MLEMQEIIRVSHVVAYPMAFILLCDRGQQGGVLKATKTDHFKVFLAVGFFFLKFLGKLRSGTYCKCMK